MVTFIIGIVLCAVVYKFFEGGYELGPTLMPMVALALITFGKILLLGVVDIKFWGMVYSIIAVQVALCFFQSTGALELKWVAAFIPAFALLAILLCRSSKDLVNDWWEGENQVDLMSALNISLLLFCGLDIYVLSQVLAGDLRVRSTLMIFGWITLALTTVSKCGKIGQWALALLTKEHELS